MYKSIVHSCDTYYYILANDMGIDGISGFMAKLGFVPRTGSSIAGESGRGAAITGLEEEALKPDRRNGNAGETISIGIGQAYNS